MDGIYSSLLLLLAVFSGTILIANILGEILDLLAYLILRTEIPASDINPHRGILSGIARLSKRNTLRFFAFLFIGVAITLFSSTIFVEAFELMTGIDLPMSSSIGTMRSQYTLNRLADSDTVSTDLTNPALGGAERFTVLRIPRSEVRLDIIPFQKDRSLWTYRSNSGHFFYIEQNDQPQIVIYASKGWRSIQNPELIAEGDNLYLQRDDTTSALFRVEDAKVIPVNQEYIPISATEMKLVLLVEDIANEKLYVFDAKHIDIDQLIERRR